MCGLQRSGIETHMSSYDSRSLIPITIMYLFDFEKHMAMIVHI
jgi:hypothetical protein